MELGETTGPTSRKRLHPSAKNKPDGGLGESEAGFVAEADEEEEEEGEPRSKRGHHEVSGSEEEGSSADEMGLQIVEPEEEPEMKGEKEEEEEEEDDDDLLSDLPDEALHATTRAQFVHHMRPYMWVKFPSAMASEITAFINARWNLLRASKKVAAGKGERRRRSEVDALGTGFVEEEEGGTSRSSRQRAAKKLAKNAYTIDLDDFEYVDSPASSAHSRDTGSTTGSGAKKQKVGRKKRHRKGKGPAAKDNGKEPRVPPMKIKMIGRSGESDSPIFFAESVESWDEGSGSEGGAKKKKKRKKAHLKEQGLESEKDLLALGEREVGEDEDELLDESRPPSEVEEHADSEGEHADYCYTCKDGGELLCCDFCPLAYHLKCLVPPMAAIPTDDWRCPRCEAEPLGGKIERIYSWRWKELPLEPEAVPASSELEDDVIAEEKKPEEEKLAPAKEPAKTYKIREFFVKWQGKSFWKNSWVSEIRVDVNQPITLRAYMRKHNMDTPPTMELPPHVQRRHKRRSTASYYDEKMEDQEITLLKAGVRPQWLQIHRVINKKSSRKGVEYLVKWRDLSYTQATWEPLREDCGLKNAPQAIKEYENLRRLMDPKKKEKKRGRKKAVPEAIKKYEEQPDCITQTGGTLHPYQLEGLNWLRFSWHQHTNTILADEMGLGKTIQTIAFLSSLYREGRSNGPFLISAPLSTIVNWAREFEFWAPDMYVVTYTGDKDNRAAIREHEFSFVDGAVKKSNNRLFKMKGDAPVKFHVLLTSYEYITVDCTVLQSIGWEVLVVDEAHRLKNNQSKFFRFLSGYDIQYKLLLTGTPLQNNLEELFHLLNFLNPESFDSLDEFQDEFADISKEDQVTKLHDLLAPHLLRRLKADVLKNIPPKRELIVRVDLAPMQKKIYRWILTRNFEKLNTRGSQPVSLLNIMMDLKKCCNHPYLFPTASQEAPLTSSGYYEGKELVQACGKFLVLEKMMKRLKEQGHRVLIFSQMTRMLDILEDFLEYMGYKFERIDGSVTGSERQISIDKFNHPNSDHFVFLLSTRAGGLGINLATADTVIIYDSDWNPHNDIQAFSRAHRIGQSNKVMIYRFVTRSSVEERITEVAKKKMMLTHLVVRPGMGSGGAAPSLSKRELDDILRFGTEDLFKDETSDTTIHYDAKTIEALLDRDQEGAETADSADVPGSENLLANEYLSSFKVASYVTKEVVDEEEEEPETEILKESDATAQPDPDFWEKLLRHHYEQQRELEEAKLGKGKRIRKQVNYLDASEERGRESDQSSYQQSDEQDTESDSDAGPDFVPGTKKQRKGQLVTCTPDGLPPLLAKARGNIYVLGFNPRQRKAFLNSVMRFGMPPPNAFHTNWKMRDLKAIPEVAFNAYVNLFMRHLCEPDNPNSNTYSDGVPCEPISRQNILTRIGIMRLVRNKVEQYKDINGTYSMGEPVPSLHAVLMDKLVDPVTEVIPMDVGQPTVVQISVPDTTPLDTTPQVGTPSGEKTSSKDSSPTSSMDSANTTSSQQTSPSMQMEATPKATPPPNEGGIEKMEVDESVSKPGVASQAGGVTAGQASDGVAGGQASGGIAGGQASGGIAGGQASGGIAGQASGGIAAGQASGGIAGQAGAATGTAAAATGVSAGETGAPNEAAAQTVSKPAVIGATSGKVAIGVTVATSEVGTQAGGRAISKASVPATAEAGPSQTGVEVAKGRPASVVQESVIVCPPGKVTSEPSGEEKPAEGQGGPSKEETKEASPASPKFMFNIADGGFTELHNLWAEEKTKGFLPRSWGRHHDYWLLKGLVTHGYCRWSEICSDARFILLNKPFSEDAYMTDSKSRFLLKRFKLLEQALAVEEQLHRASNARLYQDPNHSVMQLHSRYTDLDCLADGHSSLVADCLTGDRNSILLMKKACTKMEELLIEMKSDVARLPSELSKIPSVSTQLKMDEISIISKMAKTSASQSVITHAPPIQSAGQAGARSKSPRPLKKEVVVGSDKLKSQTKVAYAMPTGPSPQPGPQVQLPAAPLAMQTPEGLVVYSVASNTPPPQTVSVVQAGPGVATAATTSAGQTIAIGVPTYLDGSNLYQLVPAASGQQVVYWPPVVGGATQTTPAQVTTSTGVGGSQLAVVQGSPATVVPVAAPTTVLQRGAVAPVAATTTVLQPVQQGDGTTKGAKKSVITID